MKQKRKIIIIAGPNGAGKTTFAPEFLPKEADCPNFVNADLIAAGLSPFAPAVAAIKAGRLMLGQIHEHARWMSGRCTIIPLNAPGCLKKERSHDN